MMRNRLAANRARASIRGGAANPKLNGTADFTQFGENVIVEIRVNGLPAGSKTGFFAIHIHEGSDCGNDFADAGGHYNPRNAEHPMHAGDLPPLIDCGGRAFMIVMTDRFTVSDIIGRTVIIHADADDMHSQPAGSSGARIACGVIKKA